MVIKEILKLIAKFVKEMITVQDSANFYNINLINLI